MRWGESYQNPNDDELVVFDADELGGGVGTGGRKTSLSAWLRSECSDPKISGVAGRSIVAGRGVPGSQGMATRGTLMRREEMSRHSIEKNDQSHDGGRGRCPLE